MSHHILQIIFTLFITIVAQAEQFKLIEIGSEYIISHKWEHVMNWQTSFDHHAQSEWKIFASEVEHPTEQVTVLPCLETPY